MFHFALIMLLLLTSFDALANLALGSWLTHATWVLVFFGWPLTPFCVRLLSSFIFE